MIRERRTGKDETERLISIDADGASLEGILSIPDHALGVVLFVHGSGSSRFSPRNQYVARTLQSNGLATVLFDLLTPEEDAFDQETAELRFNIPFLAERVVGAVQSLHRTAALEEFPIGYFGASTGAAAALVAAAELPSLASALVSRGGRPELAGSVLSRVQAPTLLIVGQNDAPVIELNKIALSKLASTEKELVIIPGASHLFEERGTLESVSSLAGNWFKRYLQRPRTPVSL